MYTGPPDDTLDRLLDALLLSPRAGHAALSLVVADRLEELGHPAHVWWRPQVRGLLLFPLYRDEVRVRPTHYYGRPWVGTEESRPWLYLINDDEDQYPGVTDLCERLHRSPAEAGRVEDLGTRWADMLEDRWRKK